MLPSGRLEEPPELFELPPSEGPDGPPPPFSFLLGFRTPFTIEGGGRGGASGIDAAVGTGAAGAADEVAVDAGIKAGADADMEGEEDTKVGQTIT